MSGKLFQFFEYSQEIISEHLGTHKSVNQLCQSDGVNMYTFSRKEFEDFLKIKDSPLYKALK